MTKHAKKSAHLQAVELPKTTIVEIPLPLLDAFASIESSYFDLCVRAGGQVLSAMMEQDREDLSETASRRSEKINMERDNPGFGPRDRNRRRPRSRVGAGAH